MIKKILLAAAALVVVFLIVVANQPADFRITRSATIAAAPAVVFEQVNDMHHWQTWSPWAKIDPNVKITYAGPAAGLGAAFTWSGNNEVGEGSMTVTESKPAELVRFKLEFLKPFAATNVAEFTFKPEGDKTSVTWTMTGTNNFAGKAFALLMNMDKMVGGDFERGLANLNGVVSGASKP